MPNAPSRRGERNTSDYRPTHLAGLAGAPVSRKHVWETIDWASLKPSFRSSLHWLFPITASQSAMTA